ncbi:hypothetical protein Tco_0957354 [Tanacetum coccineum]
MKRGFRGAPRPLLPSMLLVATNPNAGQEHAAVAQSQPSSSTPQVQSHTSTPTPPPIHTPTPTPPPIHTPTPTPPPIPTPTPIPDTEPTPFEHIYEEPSPVHHIFTHRNRLQANLVMESEMLEGFLKGEIWFCQNSEEEEPEAQGRKSQRRSSSFSKTRIGYSFTTKGKSLGEEQVEDIRPKLTLEQPKNSLQEEVDTGCWKQVNNAVGRTSFQEEASLLKQLGWDTLQNEEIEANAGVVKKHAGVNYKETDFARKMVDLSIKGHGVISAEELSFDSQEGNLH